MQVCWLAVKIDVLVDVVEHGPAECVSDVALDQRQIRPAGAALARVRWAEATRPCAGLQPQHAMTMVGVVMVAMVMAAAVVVVVDLMVVRLLC